MLAGINAKYIQSNLAIRLLRAYALSRLSSDLLRDTAVEIAEWNVNQSAQAIARQIFERKPDVVLFSTYIWNRETVLRVAGILGSVLPGTLVCAGGPEVSYDPEGFLHECADVDAVLTGEGEQTFLELVLALPRSSEGKPVFLERLRGIAGLSLRLPGGAVLPGEGRSLIGNLEEVPFPYGWDGDDLDPETRIVYYESSRGCPFSCAYCLSSIERTTRFYPLERVFRDIDYFLDNRYPLVKFVDRTFNLSPQRYRAIWARIRDRYNGKTRFHFEIAANLLEEEDFSLLASMPQGSLQLEIGIQSANPRTLQAVGRDSDVEALADAIRRLPPGIHVHVDLIAGLPEEDLESFTSSFNFAFSLGTDVLQLGFLKILSGTPMETLARADPGYGWERFPPYEVLRSPWLPYSDLVILKGIDHLVDILWNDGAFRWTIKALTEKPYKPFELFLALSRHFTQYFPEGDLFLPRKTGDLFAAFAVFLQEHGLTDYLEWLKFDFFILSKPGRIPPWLTRRYSKETHDGALVATGLLSRCGGVRRTAYGRSEAEIFSFPGKDGEELVFFEYPAPFEGGTKAQFTKLEYT